MIADHAAYELRWLGGVVVRALDSRWAGREFDSHAAAALPGINLGQVVHTDVPLICSPSSIIWYLVRVYMLRRCL